MCLKTKKQASAVLSLINKLTEFLHLFSRYPDLQSVNTYYSLIGAVLNV